MDKITIKDREFKFNVPTAWDGCSLWNLLTSYNVPFGAASIFGISSLKQPMPPEQLETFMKLCLKNCFEIKEANLIQVVDSDGEIGINNASAPFLTQIASQFMLFFMEYWREETL